MPKSEQIDLPQAVRDLEREIDRYRKTVAFHLRLEREERGLDLADVAALCGKSTAWASLVERGKNDSHSSVAMYARALGLNFSLIVGMAESATGLRERDRTKATSVGNNAAQDDQEASSDHND